MAGELIAAPAPRGAFQGVLTVLRFNWHFYALGLAGVAVLGLAAWKFDGTAAMWCGLGAAAGAVFGLAVPTAATWLAYDLRGIHRFDWLDDLLASASSAANIHAGFDETSAALGTRFPSVRWQVMDFHDPEKHTEISIRRARRAHPPIPGTIAIDTAHIPAADGAFDAALLLLAAHEIRDPDERAGFFRELRRVTGPAGRIVVTEHLRDLANIAAYSAGAWHFHRRATWLEAFRAAGLRIDREFRHNPFITTFILKHDADSAS